MSKQLRSIFAITLVLGFAVAAAQDEVEAISALETALNEQIQAAAIISNPEISEDAAAIREAVQQAVPHVLTVMLNVGLASEQVTGEAKQLIGMTRSALGNVTELALVILVVSPEEVPLRHQELLVHGAVTLMSINQALHHLGAGPSAPGAGRILQATDLQVPDGYQIEIIANNLNFASVVEVADDGTIYVAEAGYSYGNIRAPARVLRVQPDGSTEVVAEGFDGPLAGLAVHDSTLFVSPRGKVTSVDLATGSMTDIITDLPSQGDHFNQNIGVGPDGKLYLTQGTVTNSGVVGLDN